MLEMRPNCELCDRGLPNGVTQRPHLHVGVHVLRPGVSRIDSGTDARTVVETSFCGRLVPKRCWQIFRRRLSVRRRGSSRLQPVESERCDECGFDGEGWILSDALRAIAELPDRWRDAVDGLNADELLRRPIDQMWSIAEYADHVREVFFGMRFLLEMALTAPGSDLGSSPASRFDAEPRRIEVAMALVGIDSEAKALRGRLTGLSSSQWGLSVKLDGKDVDPQWITRHAVHDATHHLGDVSRLRVALSIG